MSDVLPHTTKETVYHVGHAERKNRRIAARPTHVFTVLRVKIGTDFRGKPRWTEYPDHRAIGCGVWVVQERGDGQFAPEDATCDRCRREYAKRGDKGPPR